MVFVFRFTLLLLMGLSISLTAYANGETSISLLPKFQVDIPQDYEIKQVAIDGERMAVGVCDRFPSGSGRGAVHVFMRDGREWKKTSMVQLDHDLSQTFGCSVAISGDLLVVGEVDFAKKNGSGAVHVFRLQNGEWNKESTIPFPRSSNHWLTGFGENIAIHNGDIIVSAHVYWAGFLSGRKTNGEVYLFRKIGKNWSLKQTLMPFENRDAHSFGESLSLSNDMLAIGSARNVQSGVVYLFQNRGGKWVALDSLSPPQEKVFNFGHKIAVSNDYLVSSDHDEPVYIYSRQSEKFDYDSTIVPIDVNDKYVGALTCDKMIAIQGVNKLENKETYFVDMFEKRNNIWEKKARLTSQLARSRWIAPYACLKENLILGDVQGNIYVVESLSI